MVKEIRTSDINKNGLRDFMTCSPCTEMVIIVDEPIKESLQDFDFWLTLLIYNFRANDINLKVRSDKGGN